MNYLAALAAGDGDGRRPTLTRTEEWREDEQLDDLIPAHGKVGERWSSIRYRSRPYPPVPRPRTPEEIGLYSPDTITFYLLGYFFGPMMLHIALEQMRG